jgi:hypothetical protein
MIHWDEGKFGYIHIPAEITKTRRARAIPLNSRVSRLLRWMISNADKLTTKGLTGKQRAMVTWIKKSVRSPYLVPAPMEIGHMVEYKNGFKAALAKANKLMGKTNITAIPYNLRDSYISECAERGLSIVFVAKYVDSSVSMIERHYAMAEQITLQKIAG